VGSVNYSYDYTDWWHDDIGEGFAHSGLLYSHIMTPSLSIGLSDYFNMTISKTLGIRTMDYKGDNYTPHHRDEHSSSSFINAIGGLLGDTRFMLRYLVLNDGRIGNHLFAGIGFVIPSKNRLTKNPFEYTLDEDGNKAFDEHRHFSMSEGTYQWMVDLQYYKKSTPPIIFWGVSSSISHPFEESPEGFLSPTRINILFILLTQKIKWLNASLGLDLAYEYSGDSKWNGEIAPNSKGEVLSPGLGLTWKSKNQLEYSLNLLFPQSLTGDLAEIESKPDQTLKSFQFSFGIRKTFDYTIPFLE